MSKFEMFTLYFEKANCRMYKCNSTFAKKSQFNTYTHFV